MIGIFGGSGFYDFLEDAEEVLPETPYGKPAGAIRVGKYAGHDVAFLPRHGPNHEFPPHRVPFRANVWALKELGVETVIGPCAVGSLQLEVKPGDFVVADQLFDRTTGRDTTFFDGPELRHLSFADPFCEDLRGLAIQAVEEAGVAVHPRGTNVIIQGPRFSTRSESRFFASQGFEIINMTQIPEVPLCRELDMCYVNISVVTDYDVGVAGEIEPVTHEQVLEAFEASIGKLREAIAILIPAAATQHKH
jgi:5'-methylthioadenosine phosphorylase